MSYVYITGDKHGNYHDVVWFSSFNQTTKDDVLIVLGDNGVNYYGEMKDRRLKKKLAKIPLTFFMVRGNHDMRPYSPLYQRKWIKLEHVEGFFMVEDEFPNLLFAIDGECYKICGKEVMVIGGAYSVDKWYRLDMYAQGHRQYRWFPNEQLTAAEMDAITTKIDSQIPDVIFSHTCPISMKPHEKLLSFVKQDEVDDTMERWLDELHKKCGEKTKWYCGHWHTDKIDGNVTFMYNGIRQFI